MTATKRQSPGQTTCILHLRLSDMRDGNADTFDSRAQALRDLAARLGWTPVAEMIENDLDSRGRRKSASAYKDKLVTLPGGRQGYRTDRPRWRAEVLDRLAAGVNLISEDADREARNVRDGEDVLDAARISGASVAFLSDQPEDDDDPPVLAVTRGGTDSQRDQLRGRWKAAAKSSADTARRVRNGRKRAAEIGSYGGGRRPYGLTPDPDGQHYRRTLLHVPAEAAELRRWADRLLAGWSLKALARDARARGLATVKGGAWTPEAIRDALTKPSVAGLTVVAHDSYAPASWPAILDRETWEAVRALVDDPGRRTNTGNANEPTHLLSGIARCHCGSPVKVNAGTRRAAAYVCTASAHLRRNAAGTDALVLSFVAAYLAQEPDVLTPPERTAGVDTRALRAEAARLTAIGERQAAMWGTGEVSDSEMRAGSRARKARLDEIAGQLAAVTMPDPLQEFRGAPDAGAVLAGLDLPRLRAVVRLLMDVTLKPATRRGSGFDADSVEVGPAAPLLAA
jgi:site-specific DNA recombinase